MFIEYILCARYCTRSGDLAGTKKDSVLLYSNKEVKKVEVMGEEGTGMARDRKEASVTGAQGEERQCWFLSNPECPPWRLAHGKHAVSMHWDE